MVRIDLLLLDGERMNITHKHCLPGLNSKRHNYQLICGLFFQVVLLFSEAGTRAQASYVERAAGPGRAEQQQEVKGGNHRMRLKWHPIPYTLALCETWSKVIGCIWDAVTDQCYGEETDSWSGGDQLRNIKQSLLSCGKWFLGYLVP